MLLPREKLQRVSHHRVNVMEDDGLFEYRDRVTIYWKDEPVVGTWAKRSPWKYLFGWLRSFEKTPRPSSYTFRRTKRHLDEDPPGLMEYNMSHGCEELIEQLRAYEHKERL